MKPSVTFLPGVAEQIGSYVYLLIDPRNRRVFYVGKGTGSRCFEHLIEAQQVQPAAAEDYAKLGRIRDIEAAGKAVEIRILRHGLDQRAAFLVESTAIDLINLLQPTDLLNRVSGIGSHEALVTVEELNVQYGAKPVTIDPAHRVALIVINRQFCPGMPDDALYDATRRWWRVGPHRRQLGTIWAPEWAMAVYRGVVRAVYRIDAWEEPAEADLVSHPERKGRWVFRGQRDQVMEDLYRFRDVSSYLGARNPIRYVWCAGGMSDSATE